MILLADFFEPFIEPVKLFLERIGHKELLPYAGLIALMIYLVIFYLCKLIISTIKKLLKKKRQIKTTLDLHPKYGEEEIAEYTENYIISEFQLSSASNDISKMEKTSVLNGDNRKESPDLPQTRYTGVDSVILHNDRRYNLLKFFINDVFKKKSWIFVNKDKLLNKIFSKRRFRTDLKEITSRRYFIVLGDTGMGKTAFVLNLFLTYAKKVKREFEIEIFPLTYDKVESAINNIPNKKNTIILLDALDEDKKAYPDVHNRIAEIAALTKEFRKTIITCRSQFFTDEKYEPLEIDLKRHGDIGQHQFGRLYLSPFSDKQIRKYIRRKYRNVTDANKALQVISQIPDVAMRPMVLKYMDDFVNGKRNLRYKSDVYALIVEKWIEREKYNIQVEKRADFKKNILEFSKQIARYIYENPIGNELVILAEDIDKFATSNNIPLDSLELKSRSLLNRGEKNKYKFSHKSFLEYFLADFLYSDPVFLKKFNLKGFDAAYTFFKEQCIKMHTIPFFRSLTKYNLDKLSPAEKMEAMKDIHKSTFIPLSKLDIVIWREDQSKDYRFDWTLLGEINSIDINRDEYPDYEKIIVGIKY